MKDSKISNGNNTKNNNDWILYSKEKPKLATYYLTYSKQNILTISVWNHEYWKSLNGSIIDDITHYQQLPEPPLN